MIFEHRVNVIDFRKLVDFLVDIANTLFKEININPVHNFNFQTSIGIEQRVFEKWMSFWALF